ncbi:hypothetical protein [Candidatus Spongiihabitans sp.]|uniref:hypothetical protein n=1 Tax=Candidatus Spongiihabitans sp. TaxID=3101308 RepID=UPI003C7BED57
MVNKCHAKRDTKTCSITYNPSLPGPYYYYWPGNPVIKPFGVAELLCGEAALFVSGKAVCQKESRYA